MGKHDSRVFFLAAAFWAASMLFYLIPPRQASRHIARSGAALWDRTTSGAIPLSGEWACIDHALTLEGWESAEYATLPYTWGRARFGCASYRLRVAGLEPGRAYSLRVPYEATAYALFLNRRPISSNGQVGTDRRTSVPGYQPKTVTLPAEDPEIELILQVSNFHHRRGGPFQTLYLGEPEAIHRLDASRVAADWILVLTYLTMSLYQFVFFAVRKDRDILFLALFLLFGGANGLFNSPEVLIFRLFPAFSWGAYEKLCYFLSYGASAWLLLFAYTLYGGITRKQVLGFLAPFLAIYLFVLATPPWVFSVYNTLFQAYTVFVMGLVFSLIARARREKTYGAGVVLIGFLLLGTSATSSIFFSNDRIQSGAILSLSFLNYYHVDILGDFSLSLASLSYILTLVFINILSFAYFFKHPAALRKTDEPQTPPPALAIEAAGKTFGLSDREIEIARLILRGRTNKEIAASLSISLSTVKTHISRIFKKTGAPSRSNLFFRFQKALPPNSDKEDPQEASRGSEDPARRV